MLDCLSAGILVVDHLTSPISHLPRAGELVIADELPLSIGGNAANVSMNLARLGVRVGAVGCVGRDPFGQFAIDTLHGGGVDVRGVRVLDGVPTAATLIVNVKGEDRRFIHAAGANAAMSADGIPRDLVKNCQ